MAHVDANLNALWCRCIAEELVRGGLVAAVLCPGSRNSPLLFALAAQPRLLCLSHIDERSAGFIALGIAKASGKPVAVCVTSGSAVANLMPAVAEAHASGIPLVVLAADRPWELLGSGAPQAMPQRGIFANFVTAELALGEPTQTDLALRALRAQISRIVQDGGGPSYVNVPMRDPLPPLADPAWLAPSVSGEALDGRGADRPFTVVGGISSWGLPSDLGWLGPGMKGIDWLKPGMKGLIVAGPSTGGYPPLVAHLAAETGFPLIADAPSNLRWEECPNLISTADALVGGALGDTRPDLIIQIGAAPLARPVYEYLGRQDCPWLCLEDDANRDFLARAWATIKRPGPEVYAQIAAACRSGDDAWRALWRQGDDRARSRLTEAMANEPWGEVLAAHHACTHGGFFFTHLASSMAVRHGNLHCLPANRIRMVHANRGLNGIDGTLGTFIGECLHFGGSGLLLCGDLAFIHDLPALGALRSIRADAAQSIHGAIVVLNNDGGGIFDFLPVAQVPGYERWVRTPQGMAFAPIAEQFGLTYRLVASAAELRAALDGAAGSTGLWLIECAVPGPGAVDRHRGLLRAMAAP
ncbi:MAG: 2-succinyl-5-enolpyruvyl-6-hydroxy-3-cyclohexene-1-carboxylic-acid synthase [Planctomycetes bacterium]|nr:2-succinyl-5-enolpyruvyl-6-hydroxy-3-cyclohexene-1-carboxylic-acid synthase [Planctomycetota bacterium]